MKSLLILVSLLISSAFSCFSLAPKHNKVEPDCLIETVNNSSAEKHSLNVIDNPYGTVILHKYTARQGEQIAINYFPAYKYVLDHFNVNGVSIGKKLTFTMPNEDVDVEGIFVKAIENTPYVVKVDNTASTGESYWYFEKGEDSLDITIKVIDATIYSESGFLTQDYCEFIINPKTSSNWVKGITTSFGVTSENECFYREAVTGTMMSDPHSVEGEYHVSTTFEKRYTNRKEGYTGYQMTMSIPYEEFGMDKDTFFSTFKFNFCFHNAESPNTFGWAAYRSWLGPNEYISL